SSGRVLKLRRKHAGGVAVDTLLPGERSLQLETVTEAPLDAGLERIVVRAVAPGELPDGADVGIQARTTADRRWKQVTLRSESGGHDVSVVVDGEHVNAPRSGVGHQHGEIWGEFTLHAGVPLHHVIAGRVVFDAGFADRRVVGVQRKDGLVAAVG